MLRPAVMIALVAASVSWAPVRAGQETARRTSLGTRPKSEAVQANPASRKRAVIAGSPVGRPTNQVEAAALGNGRRILVEFKLRKIPLSQELKARCPTCGPDWVRFVVVRDAKRPSQVLARWESESPDYPTGIPWFYPQDGHVWHAGHPVRTLITVEVPYGAKVSYLYAVQWIDGKLYQVGRVGGDAGFSFSRRKSDGALIITRLSGARVDIPTELAEFYVWNGLRFYNGSREFPQYYKRLAASAAQVIEGPGDKSAIELVQSCTIALKAYDYAGSPAAGVTPCREAIDRLLTERGVVPEPVTKGKIVPKYYKQELEWMAKGLRQDVADFLKRHPGLAPE